MGKKFLFISEIGGIALEWTIITTGVPQGSVFGPLLFILYINDFPEIIKSHCKLFDDDAKIYKEGNNVEDFEDIRGYLFKLCSWTTKWLLFFNSKKSESFCTLGTTISVYITNCLTKLVMKYYLRR